MIDRIVRLHKKTNIPPLFGLLCCAALCVLFVIASPTAAQGAKDGLLICAQVMIPSLFPFFVLSHLFADIARQQKPNNHKGLLWRLFRLPPQATGVLLIGFLGGYPMGAKTAANLLECGRLTQSQAQRLQLFCVNAGPAYLIGVVGSTLLGSKEAGFLIFAALFFAGLLIGFATRFLHDTGDASAAASAVRSDAKRKPDEMLLSAVTHSTGSMLGVCAWVVLFSCLCALLELLPHAFHPAIPSIGAVLEVSSGVVRATRTGVALPVLCAVLGWGGLGVHCQMMGDLRKTGLRLKWFWVSRVLHGALAAVICDRLLALFPLDVAAAAMEQTRTLRLWAVSAPAGAAVLLFCAFLILDLDLNRKMC
ncbi:MAG: hypothetical protein LBB67_05560 [Oscillospiraceae bacterium]|nr:hypothetical protein [Oscillospiraceae bacterium]